MVKSTALSCWYGYYAGSKNKKVLTKLYQILKNNDIHISIRTQAHQGIFTTIHINNDVGFDRMKQFDKLLNCNTPEEFNNTVNWDAVNKLMLQYAPEALKD